MRTKDGLKKHSIKKAKLSKLQKAELAEIQRNIRHTPRTRKDR